MIRLTLILVAVIFAVWLFYPSAPEPFDAREAPEPPVLREVGTDALETDAEGRLTLQAETGETLVIDAVIEPRAVENEDRIAIAVAEDPVVETPPDLPAADTPVADLDVALEPVTEAIDDAIGDSVASILDTLEAAETGAAEVLTETADGADSPASDDAGAAADTATAQVIEAAPAPTPDPEPEPEPAPPPTVLQVAGDRVNFRAGPSTDNPILVALTRGARVVLIERVADGWAHLRVEDTGLEGYMSEDFLEPATAAAVATAPEPPPATAPGVTLLQVAGDRVNFRAGPSTDNIILVALNRGAVLELIERVEDGWAHLRVRETGLEGYMSEDFLEPAN